MRQYYVYLATNRAKTVIYTGVTNDLRRATTYRVGKLLYFEVYGDPYSAIRREKQLKGGSREKKLALIARENSGWRDLWLETRTELPAPAPPRSGR